MSNYSLHYIFNSQSEWSCGQWLVKNIIYQNLSVAYKCWNKNAINYILKKNYSILYSFK